MLAGNGALNNLAAQQNTTSADSDTATYGLDTWVDFATFNVTIPADRANKSLALSFVQLDDISISNLSSLLVAQLDSTPIAVTTATITVMPQATVMTLLAMATAWGISTDNTDYNAACDLNADGWVDVFDLLLLVNSWGS